MGVKVALAIAAMALVTAVAPSWIEAQTVSERRVREAIEDGARGMGQSLAGGSAVTGPAATTGGIARFRLSVVAGVTEVTVLDPTRSSGEIDFHMPVAGLTAAVGIWDGPGIGALDVVGRIGVLSGGDDFENSVATMALGGRIGVVRETLATPAVSASVYRSWVPGLGFNESDSDDVSFDAELNVWSARVDVSKGFVLATPYAGVGVDRTSIDAGYRIPEERTTNDQDITGRVETSSTHGKVYGGVELGAAIVGLTLEAGRYDGGWFGLVGLRLGGS